MVWALAVIVIAALIFGTMILYTFAVIHGAQMRILTGELVATPVFYSQ
jgi:hypothetical protein